MSRVALTFGDGKTLSNWKALRYKERFADPITTASLSTAPPREQASEYIKRLDKGELVGITVGGHHQATLMIESRRVVLGRSSGIEIECELRSPIKQLYESTVDVAGMHKSASSDVPILQFVADLVEPFGLGEVYAEQDAAIIKTQTGKGTGAKNTKGNNAKMRDAQPQSNESVYGFINRTLSRHGLLMRMGPIGDLYFTAPHYDQRAIYALGAGVSGFTGESFLDGVEVISTNEGQPSDVVVAGTFAAGHGEKQTNTPKAQLTSSAINATAPPYRSIPQLAHKPKYVRDTSCTNAEQARNVCTRVLGNAAERAFVVRGKLPGVVSSIGTPYAIDTIASVSILYVGLDNTLMWVAERSFEASKGVGLETELSLIPLGYYVIGEP